jgi:hypothetical protein
MTQPNYPPPGDPQSEGWTQPTPTSPGYPAGQTEQTGYEPQPGYVQPGYGQPGYPPAGYGQPPYGYPQGYVAPPPNNSLALTAMIISICGLMLCQLLGIVGAIMGHKARAQIRERGEGGESYATIAIIVGWVSFGLLVGIIVLYAVILGGVFATGGFDSTSSGY